MHNEGNDLLKFGIPLGIFFVVILQYFISSKDIATLEWGPFRGFFVTQYTFTPSVHFRKGSASYLLNQGAIAITIITLLIFIFLVLTS